MNDMASPPEASSVTEQLWLRNQQEGEEKRFHTWQHTGRVEPGHTWQGIVSRYGFVRGKYRGCCVLATVTCVDALVELRHNVRIGRAG